MLFNHPNVPYNRMHAYNMYMMMKHQFHMTCHDHPNVPRIRMHAKPHNEEKTRAAARSAGPADNFEYSDEKVCDNCLQCAGPDDLQQVG